MKDEKGKNRTGDRDEKKSSLPEKSGKRALENADAESRLARRRTRRTGIRENPAGFAGAISACGWRLATRRNKEPSLR
jgi:hypothetical protein